MDWQAANLLYLLAVPNFKLISFSNTAVTWEENDRKLPYWQIANHNAKSSGIKQREKGYFRKLVVELKEPTYQIPGRSAKTCWGSNGLNVIIIALTMEITG